jgi:LuxR family maltose regulon positive regulatory protein
MGRSGKRRRRSRPATAAMPRNARSAPARAQALRRPFPPKLTPPRPDRLYPRQRLFALLDRCRAQHRALWVSAPAGAGKTSLAVSYLGARKLPTLWYQVDAGDGDIASFFYYLGIAARRAAPRHRQALPPLTPEYFAEIPTFARNFFRELYRRLPKRSVLVVDNYHDAPADARLHEVLHAAMNELPEGMNLFVLSRAEPPAAFASARLGERLEVLGWEALRLDRSETLAICRRRRARLAPAAIEALHDRCDGWVAGLVLRLAQPEAAKVPAVQEEALQARLFDYFATEVFERAPPPVQDFLLRTAVLPYFTAAMARELTGSADWEAMLSRLVRDNYFTARLGGATPSYRYHDLFRHFLIARGRERFAAADRTALLRRAARLLAEERDYEAAIGLWQESGEVEECARLILEQAAALVEKGRHKQLEQWLLALPKDKREATPWLLYWLGLCRLPFSIPEGRTLLEHAYAGFDGQGDARGRYLALALILQSYFAEWDDYGPVPRWMDVLETLQQRFPLAQYPDVEPQVVAGAFAALCFACPHDPRLPYWLGRAEEVLHRDSNPDRFFSLAANLGMYYAWLGDMGRLRAIIRVLEAQLKGGSGPPLARLYAALIHAEYGMHTAAGSDTGKIEKMLQRGLAEAEQSGVRVMDGRLWSHFCYVRGLAGDLDGAEEALARMQQTLSPARRLDTAHYHYVVAYLALLRHDYAAARHHVDIAYRGTVELSCHIAILLSQIAKAQVLALSGELDEAAALADQALEYSRRMRSVIGEFLCGMTHAWIALRRGDDAQCRRWLRSALACARRQGWLAYITWNPDLMTPLCVAALEHGIEVEYVRRLIRARRLTPASPPLHLDHWPWPVKIHTLGRFALRKDDAPLRSAPKAHKKPLECLKLLVALGGREVSEALLAETLWPQAEGDDAVQALTTTLHRLRKLIGAHAILRQAGRLSIDARSVWVDTWSLERALAELERACQRNESDRVEALTARVLSLYCGPFLKGEDDTAPVLAMRERLRARLLRHLEAAAAVLMNAGRYGHARTCYEKALEVEPLAEEFYRGLMRVYLATGRRAEALATYQRCHRVLASQLGLAPSPATEALARAAKADSSGFLKHPRA